MEGKNGVAALASKVRVGGPGVLYHGALAASAATFAGHYPWFAVYNYLNEVLPKCVRLSWLFLLWEREGGGGRGLRRF